MAAIPKDITRNDVVDALRRLDVGEPHEFGKSTGYDVIHLGKRYPPKAVVGLAAKRLLGRSMRPDDFGGGEGTQCFRILRNLGFTIESKRGAAQRGEEWSEDEIQILVADYFDMLRMDAVGTPYSKAEHNRRLQELLPGRSRGSIEYKLQNVSGVLYDQKYPFLNGYKPARNYQKILLPDIVLGYVDSQDANIQAIETALEAVPVQAPSMVNFAECEVEAPARESEPIHQERRTPAKKRARRIDFATKDAINRKLGRAGEEFIVLREKWHLTSVGRPDLAERVEWVSDTQGDGLGYDIVSFEPTTGDHVYIEVKTTNCGREFPFFISAPEVEVSATFGNNYLLYRVFNFSSNPQFYAIRGDLRSEFNLKPRMYEASRS